MEAASDHGFPVLPLLYFRNLPAIRSGKPAGGSFLRNTVPACALSLDENNTTTLPYAVCSLTARKPGYRTVRIQGIQIFAGQVTLARPEMIPDTEEGKDIVDPPVIIPTHALFAGNGGSGPAPTNPCTGSRVLDRVIVPKNITVHLGRPAASARNVTVSFRDYIANVASSEVYPTWPIEA